MKQLKLLLIALLLWSGSAAGDVYTLPYSQNDPRWQDVLFPESNKTIGDEGCFLSALATIATRAGYTLNPLEAHRKFLDIGEFGSDGGLGLRSIEKITPLRLRLNFLTQKDNLGRENPLRLSGRLEKSSRKRYNAESTYSCG